MGVIIVVETIMKFSTKSDEMRQTKDFAKV